MLFFWTFYSSKDAWKQNASWFQMFLEL